VATVLLILAAISSIISIPGTAVAIWVALRKDRADVRTARAAELETARSTGYTEGQRDAQLANVQSQLNELRQEGRA
jgi:flagellar biosynthesis/type III secretory pathway protein FliH